MANFLAIFDTNPGRRRSFAARVRARLPLHEGMVSGEASKGDFQVLWACAASTPIDRHLEAGTLTIRFGQSIDEETGIELKAADLQSRNQGAHDGYHAWISHGPEFGVRASTDFLGAFPLYYWVGEERDVLLVASSPALISEFDDFSRKIDGCGMMGILMTNGLVGGRTLWKGIQRLDAGAMLTWERGQAAVLERPRPFKIDASLQREIAQGSLEDLADRCNEAFSMSVRSQLNLSAGSTQAMFSGGLDSRYSAAWAQSMGFPLSGALCAGRRDDYEASCAALAAEKLGLPLRVIDIPESAVVRTFSRAIRWEQLAGGTSNAPWSWFFAQQAGAVTANLLTGFLADSVLAPMKSRKRADEEILDVRYSLEGMRVWGLSDEALRELAGGGELADAAEWVMEVRERELREIESARLPVYWWSNLITRGRQHVCSFLWSLSHFCFPLVPAMSRRLVGLAGASPMDWLIGRGVQDLMLARRFPELSSLPLDTNSEHFRYITPPPQAVRQEFAMSVRNMSRNRAFAILEKVCAALRLPAPKKPERRVYFRLYGFQHHAGWRRVREQALRGEVNLPGLDPERVRSFLLQDRELSGKASASAPLKNLIGLLHWAGQSNEAADALPAPAFTWKSAEPVITSTEHEHQVEIALDASPLSTRVFFRVERFAPGAPAVDDALLPLLLIPAMTGRVRSLALTTPISPQLLGAAPRIQRLVREWYPRLQPVPIDAPRRSGHARSTGPRGTAAFFTGGVDSCHTAITKRDEIDLLVFVHGFDIGLPDVDRLDAVLLRLRTMASILNKPLLVVTTNLRHFADRYCRWGHHYFGSALASVGLLLAPWIRKVLIPSSYDSETLRPAGSHPELDPLWSTEEVEFVHDSPDVSRIDKTRSLALMPALLSHLRVCHKSHEDAYNCGRCEKCLRTLVHLELAGLAADVRLPFPGRIQPEWLDAMDAEFEMALPLWRQSLQVLRQQSPSPPLTAAVDRLIARQRVCR